ncbi:MAG: hypothetical protein Q7K34_04640 [archaeon]|nr:hypothetical protein [archaeon]
MNLKFFLVAFGLVFLGIGAFSIVFGFSPSGLVAGFQGLDSADIAPTGQPTKMSLQGRVEGLEQGDLSVKVSRNDSCDSGVVYSEEFPGSIREGRFDLLLGQGQDMNLVYNRDYYLCLYVNGELIGGPNVFRGGQGQVYLDSVNKRQFDNEYVNVSGDTMSGPLTIQGPLYQTSPNGALWKCQVSDSGIFECTPA